MERRDTQFITVERAVAVKAATASGPSRARIAASGVSSVVIRMSSYTSNSAKLSTMFREIRRYGAFPPAETAESAKMVGQRLRRSREALELTQRDMAKLCGLSEGNYSDVENGKRRISLNAAIRLSKNAPPLTLDWIYKGIMNEDTLLMNVDTLPGRAPRTG